MTGDTAAGITLLQRGIAAATKAGACMDRAHFGGLLTEALLTAQRYEKGLEIIESAPADLEDRIRYFYAAELHRLHGLLLLGSGSSPNNGVESALRRVRTLAREQQAPSMELRAAITLGTFLRDSGKRDQARSLVDAALGFYSADTDSPDIADARA